jgi:rhomboid protease GluP
MHEPSRIIARLSDCPSKMDDWQLVLTSAEIAYQIERTPAGWAIVVPGPDGERALRALDEFDRENAPSQPAPAEVVPQRVETYAGFVAVALLAAFYFVSGDARDDSVWFRAGSGDAGRILAGEYWRVVTALTLHVDPGHLAGNVAAGAVFLTAVCQAVGAGVGLWLVLLAGSLGNLVNAVARGAPHDAVGASTAVFGAVGVLAGLEVIRIVRLGAGRRRAWLSVAASLALLAILGTSERADYAAHLFGFLIGFGLGLGAALVLPAARASRAQTGLALGAGAAVVACWVAALR